MTDRLSAKPLYVLAICGMLGMIVTQSVQFGIDKRQQPSHCLLVPGLGLLQYLRHHAGPLLGHFTKPFFFVAASSLNYRLDK